MVILLTQYVSFYFLFFSLVGLGSSIIDDNHYFSMQLENYFNRISKFQDQLFTYIAFFCFLPLQDFILKNNSISRRILNLKLVNTIELTYPGFKKLIIRNLIKAFFFLDFVYFIISRKILHDELSKSTVLKNNAKQEKS